MGELINKLKNSIKELWSGLEKNQKITILIISIISILLIVFIGIFTAIQRYDVLYPNLEAKDAGLIRDKLKEFNIPVKVDGTTIKVPKDKIDESRIMLAMEGLPANDFTIPEMLKSSFNETTEDKKQKWLLYMQKSIANGIKSLEGVEWAQVNLFIPDDNVFILESNRLDSSASIIVKMKPGYLSFDPLQVNGIVQYVSKGVKGLHPDNISIIDDTGRSLKTDEGLAISAQVGRQHDIQESIRLGVQNSVKKLLEPVFGINNVNVMATIKLNFDSEVKNKIEYEPADTEENTGVVRSKETYEKTWESEDEGGIPGTDSNIEEIPAYPELEGSKSEYKEEREIFNYEISETKTQLIKEQGHIEDFSLSVLIDSDYKIKQEAERRKLLKENRKKSYDEIIREIKEEGEYGISEAHLKDAEQLVITAMKGLVKRQESIREEINIEDKIIVKAMDFDTSLKEQIEIAKIGEAIENRNRLIKAIGFASAALLILTIPGILLLRRKKEVTEGVKTEAVLTMMTEMEDVSDIGLDEKNAIKKKIEKFVTQKPEQVAQLLKTWLSEE